MCSIVGAQLGENVRDMALDSCFPDTELVRDLLVGNFRRQSAGRKRIPPDIATELAEHAAEDELSWFRPQIADGVAALRDGLLRCENCFVKSLHRGVRSS